MVGVEISCVSAYNTSPVSIHYGARPVGYMWVALGVGLFCFREVFGVSALIAEPFGLIPSTVLAQHQSHF